MVVSSVRKEEIKDWAPIEEEFDRLEKSDFFSNFLSKDLWCDSRFHTHWL